MKKKITGMLALSLALAMLMGMTTFAAGSVSTTNSEVTATVMTDMAKEVAPTVAGTANGQIVAKAETTARFDHVVGSIAAVVPVEAGKQATPVAVFDLTQKGISAAELSAGVTVTFKVPDFSADKEYAIMHFTNGVWEYIPAVKNADGTVSGVFHSFSPVAIVEIADAGAAGSTGATSPKTADMTMAYGMMMALCAGAAVAFKKSKNA